MRIDIPEGTHVWFSDFQVVLPDRVLQRGSIRVEDGHIAEIVDGPVAGASIAGDRGALILLPGLVDLHGDMIEKELEPRPNAGFPTEMAVFELDKRLAGAGITTAYAGVSFADPRTFGHVRSEKRAREIVETISRLRSLLLVDMRVHARFEVNNDRAPPVLAELVADGVVDLVSLTDHTPGQGQYRDLERYVAHISRYLDKSSAEVEAVARERMEQRAATSQIWDVVRSVTELARERNIPIASHDDDSPAKVELMQSLGARISEFPVTADAARAAKERGLSTVMGAPNALRGASLSGNLGALEALQLGLLDVLAADYHPGAMLHSAFAIADAGLRPLHEAVALVSRNPARAVGLADRGELAPGQRADLVIVQRNPVFRVHAVMRGGHFIHSQGRIGIEPRSHMRAPESATTD